jgi:hypothetical protein
MKNQWGRWSVWHGSDSAEYCKPPSDAGSFPSLAEATEYAFTEHDRIKLVEGGIQQITGHEQAVALALLPPAANGGTKTMTKQEAIQEQIDQIMDSFDFERVHKVMEHLNWTWGYSEEPPSLYDLRTAARERLKGAVKHGSSNTGGFVATKEEGVEDGKPWVRMNLLFTVQQTLNDGTTYDA